MIKATLKKEDMQLITSILQEQLQMELPPDNIFQVRCAIQNDELMVLIQHPLDVYLDTEKVFAVLEETLQSQSQYHEQRVQFYVRVSGEKLPYTKNSIIVKPKKIQEDPRIRKEEANTSSNHSTTNHQLIFPPLNILDPPSPSPVTENNISDNPFNLLVDEHISDNSFSSPIDDNISDSSYSSYSLDSSEYSSDTSFGSDNSFSSEYSSDNSYSSEYSSNTSFGSDNSLLDESEDRPEEAEKFDPFADGQNLSKTKHLSLPSLPILLGGVFGVTIIFGGGAFFLTRACVIGDCKELQTAQQFKSNTQQLIRQAKSQKELIAVQQQIDTVISDLKVIPQWSPRYQSAQEINSSFSDQSAKITQVLKALESANLAEQKTKTPPTTLEELRARQSLWRQAIIPLESIKPGNELYGLVRANLPKYQNNLQTLNQQLLSEESWLKKLTTAKTVAESALKREANAKSGNDWQRVQFAWQEVVNDLKSIPSTSTTYQEAKTLLTNYQPKLILARNRAKKEAAAALNFKQAVNMANQAKVYEAQNEWQAAIASWEQAVQIAKQVSQDSSFYNQAQSLIQPYSTAQAQAKEKQQLYGNLAQTRADLGKTCVNKMRFCVFNIEARGIVVRLTPEYDQALQSTPDIQSHLQTLQQALGVISENANLPVFLYNSQGQERYMKMPQ